MSSQNRKLKTLTGNISKENGPQKLINIVENHSSQSFDKEELGLLNKGLKFALPSSEGVLDEIVASVESSIQYLPDSSKGFIREACRNQISTNIANNVTRKSKSTKNRKIIKRLREKDCFYLKADKDKEDYYERLQDGEILISFDVCSLFPSVPIPQTLDYLRNLLELNNFSQEVQYEGTAMGNSLSPFIASLFMSRFETDIKEEFKYFPRIWIRYVDDIFAVFDTKITSVDSFISKLKSRSTSVNFTYEIENNGQLPFLDVLVIKNNQNNLEFDIHSQAKLSIHSKY
ncbi:hypothetical protein NQ317_003253 [Molorchus minor]|uniref:Reverse transcriptase domain-containing protein n=1 Tax=Molorchus minor TaxID=1323400 RepID=A0ABQ9IRY3_9CUCU|nr:hypothetical protein NQ317_003253 [Molorchus minor]